MANPNFLILDEPSNDLDIDTLNVLEDFLINYPGVLILVSHDRYLIDKLTEQLFIFDGEGQVTIYNGNYADFKYEEELRLKEEKSASKIQKEKESIQEVKKEQKKTLSYKEQKEYESLENDINDLEQLIKNRTNELNKITDHTELSELSKEIENLQKSLDKKSERWLELGELI